MPARKTETNLPEAYKPKRGPKAIIDHFFFKVNIKESLLIVVLAILINILFYWLFKGQQLGLYVLVQIFTGIITTWLLLGLVFYLLMYFIRGKKNLPKKPYEKILSAISAFRLTSIIYTVLVILISVLLFPSLLSFIQTMFASPALIDSVTAFPNITTANVIGGTLLFLLSIFMVFYWIVMLYELTEIAFDIKKVFPKIAITLLLMLLIFLISFL